MKPFRLRKGACRAVLKAISVVLGCLGWVWPVTTLGIQPRSPSVDVRPTISKPLKRIDLQLDSRDGLRGLVVNVNGQPVSHVVVRITSTRCAPLDTETNGLGLFRFDKLSGGSYQLMADERAHRIRVWSHGTAPPEARSMALLVVGANTVRGKLSLERHFTSDTAVASGVIAAMVAIPIILNASRDRSSPVSP